jgi:hypothetical protein
MEFPQTKRKLVWLPLPKPGDAIGDALRSSFGRERHEDTPSDVMSLLLRLSDARPEREAAQGERTVTAGP